MTMDNEPIEPAASTPSFGTTMRIDISPEMMDAAKKGKSKTSPIRRAQPVIRVPKPRAEVVAAASFEFQQLLQNIYDAVLITDMSGEVVMANIRAYQFFSAQPAQLTGYNIISLICNASDALLPTILETLKENRFVLMQAFCTRLDATFFPAEISVNRLALGGKEHLSFFVRDVTLRREQEERVRTGSTALQNASSGIAITGPNAHIEYTNPAFLEFFGLRDAAAIEGRDLRDFVGDPAKVEEVLGAIGRGETWSGEIELKRSDGSPFFGHASATGNVNADDEQVGMVLSVLDVTPQKLAQQQLETYAVELNKKNTQMQEDLDVASELHQAFLPRDFETFPSAPAPGQTRLIFRHLYSPSGTIGGDFFDIRKLSEHEVALFIADVMGHGIRSALVVATIRGLIEQLRPLALDPGALMTQLNATYTAIFKQMGGDVIFATALYAVMDIRTGLLRYANAGHPLPYVLRCAESRLERFHIAGERPAGALGLFAETRYTTAEFQLAAEDVLLLYTDGLSEVESHTGELYESLRLEKMLQTGMCNPVGELLENLLLDAQEFSGSETFEDDICLLAMQVVPPILAS